MVNDDALRKHAVATLLIGPTISVNKSTKFIVHIYLSGGPYLLGLNRDLPDLWMTVIVFCVLYRLHPFHVLLCNSIFLMKLYNIFLLHEWYECRSE